jgi:hypothetical protein
MEGEKDYESVLKKERLKSGCRTSSNQERRDSIRCFAVGSLHADSRCFAGLGG